MAKFSEKISEQNFHRTVHAKKSLECFVLWGFTTSKGIRILYDYTFAYIICTLRSDFPSLYGKEVSAMFTFQLDNTNR